MTKEQKVDKITSKEAQISVSRTMLNTSPKTKHEKILIRPYVTETATVGYKIGRVCNLGNYESLRVEVFISSPAYVEEIVDVFGQVKLMAEELLGSEIEKIMGAGYDDEKTKG